MTDAIGVKVSGLKELTAKARKLDGEMPKEIRLLNRGAAESVVPVARFLAPIDTGTLVDSIRATATARAGWLVAGGSAVVYAAPIHWGWPGHNITANEFLVEAAGHEEDRVADEYETGLLVLLRRVGLN